MINVLERITKLRNQKNWSEYQLAEQSGLTQSTISSWYRKNLIPTVPSLERICLAFGITLSQFFADDSEEAIIIGPLQKQLLENAAKLDNEQIAILNMFLEKL